MGDLGPDEWKYDQKGQCIVGERTGRIIRLGQGLKVRIVSVNVAARQLNVSPVEPLAKEPVRKRKDAKKSPKGRVRRRTRRKK
jgi:ribonuclease R